MIPVPTFKEYESKEDEIVITLDPKMSFGTGEHESTKLALRLIEKYVKGNEKVLDVGSGTGVLSIAAIKLGAANAVAVDNDSWCYHICVENCTLNDVAERIKVVEGEIGIIPEENFKQDDTVIGLNGFYNAILMGSIVEVVGLLNSGVITWQEVEIED